MTPPQEIHTESLEPVNVILQSKRGFADAMG